MRVLVDFSFICFRGYHTHKDLQFRNVGTGMCYGAIQTLFYLFSKYGWDSNQVTLIGDRKAHWKKDIYPDYKANRKREDLPKAMSVPFQINMTKLICHYLGLGYVDLENNEADDLIFTYSQKFKDEGEVIIIGNDHDLYQCLDTNVKMMILSKHGEEIYTYESMLEHSEIMPDDYWMVQTLGGCQTDNVPGMPGIGEATAQKIVNMNNFRDVINGDPKLQFPDKRSKTVFFNNHDKWNFSRDYKLVRLKCQENAPEIPTVQQNVKKVREWFLKLGFKHYLNPSNFTKVMEAFA